jgi:hypothetical protein
MIVLAGIKINLQKLKITLAGIKIVLLIKSAGAHAPALAAWDGSGRELVPKLPQPFNSAGCHTGVVA